MDALVAAGAYTAAEGAPPAAGYAATAATRAVPGESTDLVAGSRLLEECFGPVALLTENADASEALAILSRMQPSLAGSV